MDTRKSALFLFRPGYTPFLDKLGPKVQKLLFKVNFGT